LDNGLAVSVVSNVLSGTLGAALVIVCDIIGRADRQVDLRADAGSGGRRRQASSLTNKISLVALHIADVVVGLAIASTDRREVSNAVDAFLKRSVVASSVESLLDLAASEFAIVDVVATIDSANGLVQELAVAR
jgi:hypothetical protein